MIVDSDAVLASVLKNNRDELEIQMINGYTPECCPYCKSKKIWQFGKTTNGIQRYRCGGDCRRTFIPVTGTCFESRRESIVDWLEYAWNIAQCGGLSDEERQSLYEKNPKWWRLFFRALEEHRKRIKFSGYLELWQVKYRLAPCTEAEIKGEADGAYAYISIGVGVDKGKTYTIFHCDGMEIPKPDTILTAFIGNIARDTILLHREQEVEMHQLLVDFLHLNSRVYSLKDTLLVGYSKAIRTEVQRDLKTFLDCHRKWLYQDFQGYLDLLGFTLNSGAGELEGFNILRDIVLSIKHD